MSTSRVPRYGFEQKQPCRTQIKQRIDWTIALGVANDKFESVVTTGAAIDKYNYPLLSSKLLQLNGDVHLQQFRRTD